MKKNIFICIISFFIALSGAGSRADSVGRTNIRFKAHIINWTCTVNASSQAIAIDLGQWNSNAYNISGSKTTPVYFSIGLNNCNSNSVTTTFRGFTEGTNNNYLALSADSTAKNIAIEILNGDKTLLPLNIASKSTMVDSAGNALLEFYANYITTASAIQPGTANGDATFTINYD